MTVRAIVRWIFCLWLVLILPTSGHAQEPSPIAGADDPAFAQALDLWLDAKEAEALPRLADLAAQDNRAAQILLGLIDTTPSLQQDWLAGQTRDARVSLLRAKGGMSGTNWMRLAAQSEPLAQSWLRLWSGDADMQVMLDFARQGEGRAARLAAKTLALRERTGFGAVAGLADFPPLMRALALREAARGAGQAASGTLAVGDPGRVLIGLPAPAPADLDDWLSATPDLAAFQRAMLALCPDIATRVRDQAIALDAMGGWWGIAEIGSPIAALIPEERWAQSRMNLHVFVQLLRPYDPQKQETSGSQCIDFLSGVHLAPQQGPRGNPETKKGPEGP